jgi:hypothetical protein
MFALYVPYLEPPPPPVETAFSLSAALLAALALAGFGALAFAADGPPEEADFGPDEGEKQRVLSHSA